MTKGQISVLFEEADRAEYTKMRHEAYIYASIMIHGKDPEDYKNMEKRILEPRKTSEGEALSVPTQEEIDKMTKEERKELTRKMMQQHSKFVFENTDKFSIN